VMNDDISRLHVEVDDVVVLHMSFDVG
jgi:hypothetical protein